MNANNLDLFFETSAKTGLKISQVFEDSAKEIIGKSLSKNKLLEVKDKINGKSLKLDAGKSKQTKACC